MSRALFVRCVHDAAFRDRNGLRASGSVSRKSDRRSFNRDVSKYNQCTEMKARAN